MIKKWSQSRVIHDDITTTIWAPLAWVFYTVSPRLRTFTLIYREQNFNKKHGKTVTVYCLNLKTNVYDLEFFFCFSKMIFSFERWHIKSCQISGIISSQVIWDTFQSSAPRFSKIFSELQVNSPLHSTMARIFKARF